MSMHDGVSKLWILRAKGGLDVDGYADEAGAIEALIRQALTWGPPEIRAKIETAVANGLTHLDPKPQTCNKHDDCEAAKEKAIAEGRNPFIICCHSDDCEECFGS